MEDLPDTIDFKTQPCLIALNMHNGRVKATGRFMKFRYSRHAEEEMVRRGIPHNLADEVLRHAEQIIPERDGRVAYQSRGSFDAGQLFLLRLIVDVNTDPSVVVTVYRTSKIDKYWRQR